MNKLPKWDLSPFISRTRYWLPGEIFSQFFPYLARFSLPFVFSPSLVPRVFCLCLPGSPPFTHILYLYLSSSFSLSYILSVFLSPLPLTLSSSLSSFLYISFSLSSFLSLSFSYREYLLFSLRITDTHLKVRRACHEKSRPISTRRR